MKEQGWEVLGPKREKGKSISKDSEGEASRKRESGSVDGIPATQLV